MKINWKFYLEENEAVTPENFFKVLNAWIPNSPEVFVDVADYSHVQDGPKTILVGHYTDYTFDDQDRRLGFLYSQKIERPDLSGNQYLATLRDFLNHCLKLQSDPVFEGKLQFKTNELLFILNDRALFPNTSESFNSIRLDLEGALKKLLGNTAFKIEHRTNPKQRLSADIHWDTPISIEQMLSNLG